MRAQYAASVDTGQCGIHRPWLAPSHPPMDIRSFTTDSRAAHAPLGVSRPFSRNCRRDSQNSDHCQPLWWNKIESSWSLSDYPDLIATPAPDYAPPQQICNWSEMAHTYFHSLSKLRARWLHRAMNSESRVMRSHIPRSRQGGKSLAFGKGRTSGDPAVH